jgi:hypothetical protein
MREATSRHQVPNTTINSATSNYEASSKQLLGLGGIFGGGDVCQERWFSNPGASVKRYGYKLGMVRDLLMDAVNSPTMLKVFELRRRVYKFESCVRYARTSQLPAELEQLRADRSEHSLSKTTQNLTILVIQKLKATGKFKSSGGTCEFNPQDVDIDIVASGENPEVLLREQLFGEDCNVESYRGSLTAQENKIIDSQLLFFQGALQARLGTLTHAEVTHVTTKIEHDIDAALAHNETVGTSLIQVEFDLVVILGIVFLGLTVLYLFFFVGMMLAFGGQPSATWGLPSRRRRGERRPRGLSR